MARVITDLTEDTVSRWIGMQTYQSQDRDANRLVQRCKRVQYLYGGEDGDSRNGVEDLGRRVEQYAKLENRQDTLPVVTESTATMLIPLFTFFIGADSVGGFWFDVGAMGFLISALTITVIRVIHR